MNAWIAAYAQYAAAMSRLREPLDDRQIRAVQDALTAVSLEHYKLLAEAAERAKRVGT